MKPCTQPLHSTRLLDQLRERVRYLHYSLSTEKVYLYWVRFFIRGHGLRHPRDMGAPEVEAFLTMLANERSLSVSTHSDVSTTMIYTHVLKAAAGGTTSPLDALLTV